jgi:LCP family protein required for cell wall assembly
MSTLSLSRAIRGVPIPDHGHAKINAACAYGGPTLAIRTVEQVTGIRIDHFGVIDWEEFKSLTDALGGITITSKQEGQRHFNGEEALQFVGERKTLPRGDFDRIQRQQAFLRAIVDKTLAEGKFNDPLKLARVLGSVSDTVSVEQPVEQGPPHLSPRSAERAARRCDIRNGARGGLRHRRWTIHNPFG